MKQLISALGFGLWFLFTFISPPQTMAQDLCAKTCVIDAECGIGGLCNQGTCGYQNTYCGNERWSVNARGETHNCEAYRCANETGLCLRRALGPLDCLTGYVFDGTKACVPSIQCNSTEPQCLDLYERWKQARLEYEATTPEPQPAPLSCISCQDNSGCSSAQMCWKGTCVEKKNYCQIAPHGEHFKVEPSQGMTTSCGLYACDKVSSDCLKACDKSADCRDGRNCRAGLCL